ncbi:MAG TPA: hypothetical protein VG676_14565 [Chitinophagaceae bacterium]|jgi:hypothetical protein|nr:hypothetical protein [Chitinophagaceae bacterium]
MKFFLSDAGIGSVSDVFLILLLILLVVILLESVVMLIFKINNFWKSFIHSACVNICSTIAGYVILSQNFFNEKISSLGQWFIFFAITIVIEGLLMMLLYTKMPRARLWLVTLVMNIVSYLFLYLIILF